MSCKAGTGLFSQMKSPWKAKTLMAVLVSFITLMVFLPALQNEFVNWDDVNYVYENPYIRSPWRKVFKWAFASFSEGNWHPLTWISHAIDYNIWGLKPLGHHLTNNVLHALNALLVVFLSIGLLESDRRKKIVAGFAGSMLDERGILIAGTVAGLLFGIHPLHVESVAWVSERKDVLSSLFFFLSILSYMRYVGVAENRGKTSLHFNRYYLFTLGFFICALLSKPMAVTLPAVLIILDWYPFQRIRSLGTFGEVVKEKVPFFVLSISSSIITVLAESRGRHIVPLEAPSVPVRLMIGCDAIFSYLRKMVLPLDLSPFYPYPKDVFLSTWKYLLPVSAVIGITLVCLALSKHQKVYMAVWGYYLITLLPVLGIIRVGMQSMADRYTYVPSIGPFILLGLAVARGYEKLDAPLKKWGVRHGFIGFVLGFVLLVSLSVLTMLQIRIWKNSVTLWTYVIEKTQVKIPFVYNNRGIAYNVRGEYDLAIKDLDTALALKPDYIMALNNRGLAYENRGMYDLAIEDFTRAIALNPDYNEAYNNRGLAYDHKGMHDQAIEDFTRAIALNPDYNEAYNNRGVAYGGKRLLDNATKDFDRAIALKPDYFEALCNRGYALKLNGQYELAVESYTKAIALDRTNATAYINRAYASLEAGDTANAISDLRRGCGLGNETGCKELKTLVKN